jgi:hypothetical protein
MGVVLFTFGLNAGLQFHPLFNELMEKVKPEDILALWKACGHYIHTCNIKLTEMAHGNHAPFSHYLQTVLPSFRQCMRHSWLFSRPVTVEKLSTFDPTQLSSSATVLIYGSIGERLFKVQTLRILIKSF